MTSSTGQQTQQTGRTAPGIDETRLILWTSDGSETDVGDVATDTLSYGQGMSGPVATDVLRAMGYRLWFDIGDDALRIYHTNPQAVQTPGDEYQERGPFPYLCTLEHGNFVRCIVFTTLHDLATFVNEWTPIVTLWDESN